MNILIGIPHVFNPQADSNLSSKKEAKREVKANALKKAIFKNLDLLSSQQWVHKYNQPDWITIKELGSGHNVQIELHTIENMNLLATIKQEINQRKEVEIIQHTSIEPTKLPLIVTKSLLESARNKNFDIIVYIEDDITIEDRELLDKINHLHNKFGNEFIFMPHRCEYIEGIGDVILSGEPLQSRKDLPWATGETLVLDWLGTEKVFERVANPHSGCFFLKKEQAIIANDYWSNNRWEINFEWVGPLEMACTGVFIPIFKMMKIDTKYARFLQVKHNDELWKNHI